MSRISDMLPRHFGPYGGRYVPEMLVPALEELEQGYRKYKDDPEFTAELTDLYQNYCGRPTPLYFAENLTRELGGCKIYLKLEGLAHTGAHTINNALGQALLAKRLGKTKVIAETGAGQHGLASATVAARFGLECKVFMGEVDVRRQYPNVYAMKLLGAEVIPVTVHADSPTARRSSPRVCACAVSEATTRNRCGASRVTVRSASSRPSVLSHWV